MGGKCAGSADEYANRNAELLVRAYHLGPRRSLYCACYAMPLRALGRRFRCSLDDAREELT